MEKVTEFQKYDCFCFTDYTNACTTCSKLKTVLKTYNSPLLIIYLICRKQKFEWSEKQISGKLGKECAVVLYRCFMRNVGLQEIVDGIKIAGRNSIRYAYDSWKQGRLKESLINGERREHKNQSVA